MKKLIKKIIIISFLVIFLGYGIFMAIFIISWSLDDMKTNKRLEEEVTELTEFPKFNKKENSYITIKNPLTGDFVLDINDVILNIFENATYEEVEGYYNEETLYLIGMETLYTADDEIYKVQKCYIDYMYVDSSLNEYYLFDVGGIPLMTNNIIREYASIDAHFYFASKTRYYKLSDEDYNKILEEIDYLFSLEWDIRKI